jgi:hypothetical protein
LNIGSQDHKFADPPFYNQRNNIRKKQQLVNQKIKNMTTDFLHAIFRKDGSTKRTCTRVLFLCAFLMAFMTSNVSAQFTSAGIDGNPQEWTQANINSIPIHSFIHDAFGNGVVDSQFTEGSKDFLFAADLRWVVSQTKAKNDIANAAALLTDGKLFFAGDRTSNNGDAQIAFWFYLNGTAPHVRTDGTQDFAPEHAIGDLLILADFTGGGRSANVTVLQWVETGGNVPNTNGTLNTTNIVGTVAENNAGAVAVPAGWIFTGNTFATNEFYEGVIDLGGLNLPSLCFSSFLLETRSSQSITASLDDFASSSFNARPQPPTVTGAERCGGGVLTLTASCTGSGVQWFTNAQGGTPLGQADGVSADGNSLTRNFNTTQTFFVSCFNAQINCESERVPVTGTINPPATSDAGADQTVCASAPQVTLAGIVGGSATSGTWSGGTGTFNPNANTLNAVYTPSAPEIAAGFVELTLTTNDPAGPCAAATDKMRININPVATVNAGADQTVCSASPTVTLAGIVGGGATSGTWSGGTGTFNPNANTLNAIYTLSAPEVAAGFVELTLTTNDPAGPCPSVSDKVRILVTNDATVNAGPDQEVCASSPSVTLAGVVGGGATSGTWSGGTGTFNPNANTLNAVYTPSAPEIAAGFVVLTLTTNDPEGPCNAAQDVMRITIHPNPVISLTDLTPPACAGNNASALLTVTSGSAPFDVFLDGTQILDNINAFPQQLQIPADGNNHLIKVVDAKGCEDVETVNGGTPPPPIIFTLNTRLESCFGANDGCIIVNISGGTPPYKVQLNNGAPVQLAANETTFEFCNLAPGIYTVHVTDANNCPVDDQLITVHEGPECAPLPTGHCTYTQGQYGTFNGQACLPDGSSVLAQDIMTKALDAEPNDFRDFGVVANNKFFRLTLSDVTGGSGANIYKMLPGGGNACALKGFATFAQPNTWPNVPLSTKPQTFGKILNTLLAQTITLYFNLSEDPSLGGETVQDTIITSQQTFCGSGIVQPDTEDTFAFPHSVVLFLNNSNDAFDYSNTVAGLFKLANDILGGVSLPVNCTDVAAAVDVFNNAFDGCRIQTGSIPFNDASSLIVSNSTQAKSTKLGRSVIENPDGVQVKAYPNPFSNKVNFHFVSPVTSKATLEIYNISGQRIALLFSGMVDAGIPKVVQYTKGKTAANSTLVYKLTIGDKAVYGKIQTVN